MGWRQYSGVVKIDESADGQEYMNMCAQNAMKIVYFNITDKWTMCDFRNWCAICATVQFINRLAVASTDTVRCSPIYPHAGCSICAVQLHLPYLVWCICALLRPGCITVWYLSTSPLLSTHRHKTQSVSSLQHCWTNSHFPMLPLFIYGKNNLMLNISVVVVVVLRAPRGLTCYEESSSIFMLYNWADWHTDSTAISYYEHRIKRNKHPYFFVKPHFTNGVNR